MIGKSAPFVEMLSLLKQLAYYDAVVLLEGETGTGKELAARAIHYEGPRRAKSFTPINCGALQDTLIENELFGHCRGAYTGAHSDEPGLVEAARGGTLFLDEVDSLSPKGQVTLLRFLEDDQYRPVGARTHRNADVRTVAASNRPLAELVKADRFRADLFYRLRVIHIEIPPLRERKGDALLLAQHFAQLYSTRFQRPLRPLSRAAAAWLDTYHWPGNVRELQNVICRAVLFSHGPMIDIAGVPSPIAVTAPATDVWNYRRAKRRAIEDFERRFLSEVMRNTAGNVSQAARLIETERRHLGRLLKKHGFSRTPPPTAKLGD